MIWDLRLVDAERALDLPLRDYLRHWVFLLREIKLGGVIRKVDGDQGLDSAWAAVAMAREEPGLVDLAYTLESLLFEVEEKAIFWFIEREAHKTDSAGNRDVDLVVCSAGKGEEYSGPTVPLPEAALSAWLQRRKWMDRVETTLPRCLRYFDSRSRVQGQVLPIVLYDPYFVASIRRPHERTRLAEKLVAFLKGWCSHPDCRAVAEATDLALLLVGRIGKEDGDSFDESGSPRDCWERFSHNEIRPLLDGIGIPGLTLSWRGIDRMLVKEEGYEASGMERYIGVPTSGGYRWFELRHNWAKLHSVAFLGRDQSVFTSALLDLDYDWEFHLKFSC